MILEGKLNNTLRKAAVVFLSVLFSLCGNMGIFE